ncbi:PASTA domain-containing protein [Streptomyces sp. NPDC057521]|uniref:PASTA domain-containing protein n=1 Tax=Streptomyces sp. NPDC057521 TaxID=3346156 RepID=UPI00367A4AA6
MPVGLRDVDPLDRSRCRGIAGVAAAQRTVTGKWAMKLKSFGRSMASILAVAALSAGCSNHTSDGTASAAPSKPASAPLPPDSLPIKMKEAAGKGLGFSVRDATDLGRTVDLQHTELWRACLTRKGMAPDSIDFAAVPRGEKCPDHWDAHVPTPKTPDLMGKDFEESYELLLKKGYNSQFIAVFDGSRGAVGPEDVPQVHGKICSQSPKPGAPYDASEHVELRVATGKCPSA